MFDLQNRWRIEGDKLVCYGMRKIPNLLKNEIKINGRQKRILEKLPCELSGKEIAELKGLFGEQVVDISVKRTTPASLEEAVFCRSCAANDFMIPGIEFDENGLCPMCSTADDTSALKSVVPVMNSFPRSEGSRFDVAVFYTGGKDSTFLLHYLANVLGLRVLALTWEIPYISESARKSIENAKSRLKNVEFVSRRIADSDLKRIYAKLYSLSGNVCACPSLAYVLFYPDLVNERVPYFVVGNEPVQMTGLYYNHIAPRIAYSFAQNRFLNALINAGRILTLRPPLKSGQFHTLAVMKQLAYGDGFFKKMSGYTNELVSNVVEAIAEVPHIISPLKRAIRYSSRTGKIPAFVHVDLDEICGGKYEWDRVKETVAAECGWSAPEQTDKGLHTSCRIEKCKEHTQFVRFYRMESRMIPFSALEIALAVRNGNVTRGEAIAEIKESLGFSLDPICEYEIMKGYFE